MRKTMVRHGEFNYPVEKIGVSKENALNQLRGFLCDTLVNEAGV